MATLTSTSKVVIVGAGVSGLALAQMLRKQGIAFEIFERDDGTRNQGWTVGLDKCLPRLQPLLPDDVPRLENASVNQAAGGRDSVAFIDGQTHKDHGTVSQDDQEMIMANRNIVRKILATNLEIHYSKHLVSYQSDSEGVTANFADGSSTRGTLLVGADGSSSRVRSQLLHPFQPVLSRAVVFDGETDLTKSESQHLAEKASVGVLFGDPAIKGTFFIGAKHADGSASYHWTVAWVSDDPEQNHAWSEQASREELLAKVVDVTAHLPPYIKDPIHRSQPRDVRNPPIKLIETVLPVDKLPVGPVTLLGDAAHSMVPFRGMGANTALTDAVDLFEAIVGGVEGGKGVEEVLRPYEELIIPRGREQVLASRAVVDLGRDSDLAGGRLADKNGGER